VGCGVLAAEGATVAAAEACSSRPGVRRRATSGVSSRDEASGVRLDGTAGGFTCICERYMAALLPLKLPADTPWRKAGIEASAHVFASKLRTTKGNILSRLLHMTGIN